MPSRKSRSREVDERAARRTLRDQIARLERELVTACLDACPRIDPGPPLRSRARPAPPRRSGSSSACATSSPAGSSRVRGEIDAQLLQQAESRVLVERMLADPPAHKWLRVSNAQLGEPGCKHFHVRPRLGPDRPADGLVAGQDLLRAAR